MYSNRPPCLPQPFVLACQHKPDVNVFILSGLDINGLTALHAGLVFFVLLACNIAYAAPISTPCVTMTLSGGYQFTDYLKVGLPLTAVSHVVLLAVVMPLYSV